MTLLAAVLGVFEHNHKMDNWYQCLIATYVVLTFLLELLLLFFLWHLEFRDRTAEDLNDDTERGVSLYTASWDEEAEEQACIWNQFVRNRR